MTDLTPRELKTLAAYQSFEGKLAPNQAATIRVIADTAFPSFPKAKADRVVRNSIRRLIAFGLLSPVGPGAYRVRG